MNIIATALQGCFIIEPQVFEDARGYFVETFQAKKFEELTGVQTNFVQDNESCSSYGVLRGLHAQSAPMAQAKLVRVTKGKVIDVAVDYRPQSATYLQHIALELSGTNKKQLYIPEGFLHGFVVLENDTIFNYKCNNLYSKANELGIHPLDPTLNINWGMDKNNLLISEKDLALPFV
jgi:dTDP-4-dehydrorhamnose 3,5-epimerase